MKKIYKQGIYSDMQIIKIMNSLGIQDRVASVSTWKACGRELQHILKTKKLTSNQILNIAEKYLTLDLIDDHPEVRKVASKIYNKISKSNE